ncbi:DUF72 domain-containing protein [Candidatus Bipolaricaulota sp. J31]
MRLHVGCCGWNYLRGEDVGEPEWRRKYPHKIALYAAHFPAVEVNSSFYKLPRPATAARWREIADEVNPNFVFTVKAYQGLTHKARFRGEEAREAFRGTAEIARALRAEIVLLQTPPSFGPSEENVAALVGFLREAERDGLVLVWEPRGRWERERGLVEEIVREHGLVHCTDPFKSAPVVTGDLAYLRLHGSPPGDRMYRYTYTDDDLRWLAGFLRELPADEVYLFFNNDTMYRDALRFMRLWEGR